MVGHRGGNRERATFVVAGVVLVGCVASSEDEAPRASAAPAPVAAPVAPRTAPACQACAQPTIQWRSDYLLPLSTLESCNRYVRSNRDGILCTTRVSCEPGTIDPDAIYRALEAPVLAAAFAESPPPLFGEDFRGVDGHIFVVTVGDRTIEIGDPRGGRPIPPEVNE